MNLTDAYSLLLRGTQVLARVEAAGIAIDADYLARQITKTGKRITKLQAELRADPVFAQWRREYGDRTNLGSGEQLAHLVFDVLGYKSKGKTATGKHKSDEAAFVDVDLPFVKKYFQVKKLEKSKGTYLEGIQRETVDGFLHPNFDLHTAISFRGSSSNPNFQNLPIRDPAMGKLIRRCFVARPGHVLVEVDFGGIEVRVAYCYHKDPVMYKYLTDPTTDMHRDMGAQCYKLKTTEVTKQIRYMGKNKFVFPQFYGSYFQQCAPSLWEAMDRMKLTTVDGTPVKQRLAEQGIKKLGACDPKERPEPGTFEHHIKEVEEDFWGRRFKVYTQWKEQWYETYRKTGSFRMKTGFEVSGLLNRNDVLNYGIQGCLAGTAKVQTIDGWIPIKDLVGVRTKVWTGFKWADAIGLDRGKCQRAEITLSSGLAIQCDTRHKLKNAADEWVVFHDLKKGDWVALPKTGKPLDWSGKVNWPFVMGFLIGDGYLCKRKGAVKQSLHIADMRKLAAKGVSQRDIGRRLGVSHTTVRLNLKPDGGSVRKFVQVVVGKTKRNQLAAIEEFLITQGFSPKWNAIPAKENRAEKYRLVIENRRLVALLERKGLVFGSKTRTKRIPESVWSMSVTDQREFMEGLWLSDGNRKGSQQRNLHMANPTLLRQVQVLIGPLGFDSSLCQTGTGWLLRVYWKGDRATCNRAYPYETLQRLVNRVERKNYDEECPYIVDHRTLANTKGRSSVGQFVAERAIQKNADQTEVYRYDRITSIRILDEAETTYTMSVDDPLHQFVADGVLHKNSAFHCLLWSLIRLQDELDRKEMKSLIVGQIHDSLISDVPVDELQRYLNLIHRVTTKDLPASWPWICVPLEVECEVCPDDGTWYDKSPWVKRDGLWQPAPKA